MSPSPKGNPKGDDLSVHIVENGETLISESLKDSTTEEIRKLQSRINQIVTDPKDDYCRNADNHGQDLGTITRAFGPLAMRQWTVSRCRNCGSLHARLTLMA